MGCRVGTIIGRCEEGKYIEGGRSHDRSSKYRNMWVRTAFAMAPSSIQSRPPHGISITPGKRSDVHFWHDGCIGPMQVTSDHILGHESAGVILSVHPSAT